jgi:hypothetical protein
MKVIEGGFDKIKEKEKRAEELFTALIEICKDLESEDIELETLVILSIPGQMFEMASTMDTAEASAALLTAQHVAAMVNLSEYIGEIDDDE